MSVSVFVLCFTGWAWGTTKHVADICVGLQCAYGHNNNINNNNNNNNNNINNNNINNNNNNISVVIDPILTKL